MRKSQSQPSLASLTEADREQLAEWLRHEEYHSVLAQVNRPRPDGFGLTIKSDRPLRTFYAKVALLDVINARLPENKKIPLALFESLARRDIYLLTSADSEKLADAHEQILRTTTDLASSSDNTPHQLLALQRLADFPARAAVRHQMSELRAAKEERAQAKDERAQAKAERDAEAHAWKRELLDHKIALDLRKEAHQKEMDEQSLKLRREQFEARNARSNPNTGRGAVRVSAQANISSDVFHPRPTSVLPSDGLSSSDQNPNSSAVACDHLGPLARTLEDIRERARKAFGITPEESARRAELRRTWVDPNAHLNQRLNPNPSLPPLDESPAPESDNKNQNSSSVSPALTEDEIAALIPHVISPRPLPPEVIAANLRYAEKVRTGKIIIDRSGHYIRAIELPDLSANPAPSNAELHSAVSPICNRQPGATPASTPQIQTPPESQNNPCVLSTQTPTSSVPTTTENISSPSSPSASQSRSDKAHNSSGVASSALIPTALHIIDPAELATIVDTYTVKRAREHVAYQQKHTPWPYRHSPPQYITEFRHCPCGKACPCPIHEADPFGPFPEIFWKLSPFSRDYAAFLEERNLPYRLPREFLA